MMTTLLFIEFVSELFSSWYGVWKSFESFLNGFAEFGVGGAQEAVGQYGESQQATPTTRLLGIIYVIAQVAPGFAFAYVVSKYYVNDTKRNLAIATLGMVAWLTLTSYILNLRPNPFHAYEKFAYGPISIFSAIRTMFTEAPVEAFTVWVVIFGSFFIFSFLMWYLINFIFWVFTSYRQEPLFTNTSAKALSLWLTVIWIFYLTMGSAGGAFFNTLFFLGVVLISRSNFEPGPSGSDPESTETIDLNSDSQPDPQPDPGNDSTGPSESGSGGQLEWVN